ncbi:unnamed protein product [Owenia fusiformis]|uniref:Uncharacterized protein n=1 Tax=Owenia fusiformis TaxID=6347 RepID=A0A8J1TXZ7_OWEFU|nr:unnamed protein product [Owenia fusiformis]
MATASTSAETNDDNSTEEKIVNNAANKEQDPLKLAYYCTKIRDQTKVVLELKGGEPPEPDGKKTPLRIQCVIDISYSMEEPYGNDDISKLDKMKMFSQLLVEFLSDDDILGIVTFGTDAWITLPPTHMTAKGKLQAKFAIDNIISRGTTNLSAGLLGGIEMFLESNELQLDGTLIQTDYRDTIILFSDGLANKGIKDANKLIPAMRRRLDKVGRELDIEDYDVTISAFSTGGYIPELLFQVGQSFSSDAFYFLDDDTDLEVAMMKPVLMRESSVASGIKVHLKALNGVTFQVDESTNEFRVQSYEDDDADDNQILEYFIHDISPNMERHVIVVLDLPEGHEKTLKGKDVMKIEVRFRDKEMARKRMRGTVSYSKVPLNEDETSEKALLKVGQQESRNEAYKALRKSTDTLTRRARPKASRDIEEGIVEIQSLCEHIGDLLTSEDSENDLLQYAKPLITNLEYCIKFLRDPHIAEEDAWCKMTSMSSAIIRESPAAGGTFAEGADLFLPSIIEEKIRDLRSRLVSLYESRGLSPVQLKFYERTLEQLKDRIEILNND